MGTKYKRPKIDWEKGEKLYRLGQLSAAEIGKQLGCPTSTVTRHMKVNDVPKDKAKEVQRRTKEAIVTQRNATVEGETQRNVAEVTEEEIENAVNTNIALVMSHRTDLNKLAKVEDCLFSELIDSPTKLYITQYQGGIVQKEVGLTVTEKAATLASLTSIMAKRIEKQRQAFGIEDNAPLSPEDETSEIIINLVGTNG